MSICWFQLNTDLNTCAMLSLVLIAHTQELDQGSIAVLIQVWQVRMEVGKKIKEWQKKKKRAQSLSTQARHPRQRVLRGHCWLTDRVFTVGGVFSRKRRINRASSSAVIPWLTMATSSSTSTVWQSVRWPMKKCYIRFFQLREHCC